MKVLVVGQGGREHAIVKSLKLSPSVTEVHVLPGNDGIATEAICHDIAVDDLPAVLNCVKKFAIELVIVGPEVPLAKGLSDHLRQAGVAVFGPSQEAARLEASKVFAKKFMEEAKVPTARFKVVTNVDEALAASRDFRAPFVLKADGLAAGKGVFITKTQGEFKSAAQQLFVQKTLGEAGAQALVEEFQPGWELSYLVLTNGDSFEALPVSQDHKRLQDKDQGPNTGGMGVIGPIQIEDGLRQRIDDTIVKPTLSLLKSKNMLYRGVLYFGIMITPQGPQVLEFNVRFGDPEAQVILPLLDGDWGLVFKSLAQGHLQKLKWKPLSVCCVVMAAEGYPDEPKKGSEIRGNILAHSNSSYFLHAGTKKTPQGHWVTHGGRVLNSVGIGSTIDEAIEHAYRQAENANWSGRQMRRDIGARFSK